MIFASPGRAIAGCLLLALVAGFCPVSGQQAPRKSSSKIVAFDGDTPEEPQAPAEPAVASPVDPRRPAQARAVLYGRVVPPAPRVVLRTRTAGGFVARPAVASRLPVNSRYGIRHDPFTGAARMHTGVDLAVSYGESIGTSMSGTVLHAGPRGGYGNLVVVDHGSGLSTYYAHLSQVAVVVGQMVEAGELIGYAGSTGRSTGPHLHYEIRANGHPFDPFLEVAIHDGGFLSVNGHRLAAAPSGIPERALPLAPGGTQMLVSWDDSTTEGDAPLKVDLE